MLRISLLITILIASMSFATANTSFILMQGKGFSLTRSVTVISSRDDLALQQSVIKILAEQGTIAGGSFSTKMLKPRIILERVRSIDNVNEKDAYRIRVTSKRITISYTSNEAAERAISKFATLVTPQKWIAAGELVDWNRTKIKKGIIDASKKVMSMVEIESSLKHNKEREIFLQLVDANNWRVECSTFELINPEAKIYPKDGYYKLSQINSLLDKVNNNRFTLIPTLDLITPNNKFEEITGHSQFSVEGMRFIRAIIEEVAKGSGSKKICVGTKGENTDQRYIDFFKIISKKCDIDIIIME